MSTSSLSSSFRLTIILNGVLWLGGLVACGAPGASGPVAAGLEACIGEVGYSDLVREVGPTSLSLDEPAAASTTNRGSTLFRGRQHWTREFVPHGEVLAGEHGGFGDFCGRLELELRAKCSHVSSANRSTTEDLQSCTLFLSGDDEAAVVRALLLRLPSGNGRILVVADGW